MDVHVTARAGSGGSIDWDIDGQHPANATIEFPEKTGPHTIHFILDDQSGRDLQFDGHNAFWADKNEAGNCPPPGGTTDQTDVAAYTAKRLTVVNKNRGEPCTIHYQLNFVDGEGQSQEVDPEFKNGGGTT